MKNIIKILVVILMLAWFLVVSGLVGAKPYDLAGGRHTGLLTELTGTWVDKFPIGDQFNVSSGTGSGDIYTKVSDSHWSKGSGGGAGAVSSVFTRIGDVVAQSGDYSAPLISGLTTSMISQITGSDLKSGADVVTLITNSNLVTAASFTGRFVSAATTSDLKSGADVVTLMTNSNFVTAASFTGRFVSAATTSNLQSAVQVNSAILTQATNSNWQSGAQVSSAITSSLAPYATTATFTAHTTATGTNVHGLGTMAALNSSNVGTQILGVTGLSSTGTFSNTGNALIGSGTTNANYVRIWTGSGYSYYGIEGAAGGEIVAGTNPYASVIRVPASQTIQKVIGTTVIETDTSTNVGISTSLSVTGAIESKSTGSFNGIVNANGVVLPNNVYLQAKNTSGLPVNIGSLGADNNWYFGDSGVNSSVNIANSVGSIKILATTGTVTIPKDTHVGGALDVTGSVVSQSTGSFGGAITATGGINSLGSVTIAGTGNRLYVQGIAALNGGATVTGNVTATGALISANINASNQQFSQQQNSAGYFYQGMETGLGGFFTGATPSAAVLYSNRPIEIILSGVKQGTVSSLGMNVSSITATSGITSLNTGSFGGTITANGGLSSVGVTTFSGGVYIQNTSSVLDDGRQYSWGIQSTGVQGNSSSNTINLNTSNIARMNIASGGTVSIGYSGLTTMGAVTAQKAVLSTALSLSSGGTGTTLVGTAGYFVKVNPTQTGYEFAAISGGGDMLKSDNLSGLANYTTARNNLIGATAGNALKVVRVNAGGTDLEYAVSTGGSTSLVTSVTWSTLNTMATVSYTLVPGMKYRITDFRTYHLIYNTASYQTGTVEALVVTALTNSLLDKVAVSESYPSDIIYYELNGTHLFGGSSVQSDRGWIYYREDTIQNNKLTYDFRNVKWRRWNTLAGGTGSWTVLTDNTFPFQDFYTFNGPDSAYSDNDFSSIGNKLFQTNQNFNNVFLMLGGTEVRANRSLGAMQDNTFLGGVSVNTFGIAFNTNVAGDWFSYNTFEDNFSVNSIGQNFYNNHFGVDVAFGLYGDSFQFNEIGSGNGTGGSSGAYTFGVNCRRNYIVGSGFSLSFGDDSTDNKIITPPTSNLSFPAGTTGIMLPSVFSSGTVTGALTTQLSSTLFSTMSGTGIPNVKNGVVSLATVGGGFSFVYAFDNTTTQTPANGTFTMAATFATTTRIFLNEVDSKGVTIDSFIDNLQPRDVVMISNADRSAYAIFNMSASFISGAGVDTLPVTYVASVGSFLNGEKVYLSSSTRYFVTPSSSKIDTLVTWGSTTNHILSSGTGTGLPILTDGVLSVLTGTGSIEMMNSVPTVTTVALSYVQYFNASHTTVSGITITNKLLSLTTDGDSDTDIAQIPSCSPGQELEVFVASNGNAADSLSLIGPFSSGTNTYDFGQSAAGRGLNLLCTSANKWVITGQNSSTESITYSAATQTISSTTGAAITAHGISTAANKSYEFTCKMLSSTGSTTNLIRFAINAPASSAVTFLTTRPTSTSAVIESLAGQWASTCTNCSTVGGSSSAAIVVNKVEGLVSTTAAGRLELYGAVTFNGYGTPIWPRSTCVWKRLN